jgi:transcriptional regulator with XRE-family HTH domain
MRRGKRGRPKVGTPKAKAVNPDMQTFATRLREAMGAMHFSGAELSRQTGFHTTTISRYQDPTYSVGPPRQARQHILERTLGIPEGYLSGEVDADLDALYLERKRGGAKPSAKDVRIMREPAPPPERWADYAEAVQEIGRAMASGAPIPYDRVLYWFRRLAGVNGVPASVNPGAVAAALEDEGLVGRVSPPPGELRAPGRAG